MQNMMAVGVPTLAVLLGVLINNSRLTDLRLYMDARFAIIDKRIDSLDKRLDYLDRRFDALDQRFDALEANLKETWRAELRRVEEVLDARLKHLEDNR